MFRTIAQIVSVSIAITVLSCKSDPSNSESANTSEPSTKNSVGDDSSAENTEAETSAGDAETETESTGSVDSAGEDDADDDDDDDDDDADDDDDDVSIPKFDLTMPDSIPPVEDCEETEEGCYPIDILFVIDNSGTMGHEQINLARNFPKLIQQLIDLTDHEGKRLEPNVNLMVTSSDMDHPICKQFQPMGYTPLKGSPTRTNCNKRISHFTGLGEDPPEFPQACTDFCEDEDLVPSGPFIHFGADGKDSNVPGDRVVEALSCIGPQGVSGCGYESPLEAMMQALNPSAEWNKGDEPFLRDNAILAVVMMTDEADCSVLNPGGYEFFSTDKTYWEEDPSDADNEKTTATSAICWNGGVDCTDADGDGVYETCQSKDKKVLQPTDRYIKFLREYLGMTKKKRVVMLGILGVPEVTKHNPDPPYQPLEGGVFDLVYRDWLETDILPGEPEEVTAATKKWNFGIGPGCTGATTGQGIPPTRVKEVCESLNTEDDEGKQIINCCIESICDEDFSDAIKCLSGLLEVDIPQG